MDIRLFFAKVNSSNSNSTSTTTNTNDTSNTKAGEVKSGNSKSFKNKEVDESKQDENKNIEFEEFEFLNIGRRSLKSRIIHSSDSDSNSDENSLTISNHKPLKLLEPDGSDQIELVPQEQKNEKEESVRYDYENKDEKQDKRDVKSVSNLALKELKTEIVDQKTGSNLQSDIQFCCNDEKKEVDLSTFVRVKTEEKVDVDMNTYLNTISMSKTPPKTRSNPDKSPSNTSIYTISSSNSNDLPPINTTNNTNTGNNNVFSNQLVNTPINTSDIHVKENTGFLTPKRIIEDLKTISFYETKEKMPMISLFSSESPPTVISVPSDSFNSASTPNSSVTIHNTTDTTTCTTTVKINTGNKKSITKKNKDTFENEKSTSRIEGKKFVFTGEMGIDRLEATLRVKKLGGIVVSAVSGVTDYLVYGDRLEDGRPYQSGLKYKKAIELNNKKKRNIQLLNEEQFLQLLQSNIDENVKTDNTLENIVIEDNTIKDDGNTENINSIEKECMVLFEKYRPKRFSELIGNPRSIQRLKDWLQHFPKDKGKDEFKAALLSGPPGIGKTTCAKLVGQFFNYHVIELNASDQRSKNSIENIFPLVTGTLTLNTIYSASSITNNTSFKNKNNNSNVNGLNAKTLLILDEVDGMSSGDKGGIQAISELIDITKCPIILICNDRFSQKMSTLSNKCLDLRFNPPPIDLYINRINKICKLENIKVTENLLLELYHKSSGDLRYTLNYLQFYNSNTNITPCINKKDESHFQNLFDNCNKVFHLSKLSFTEKINKVNELFFTDFSLMPLMLQENYFKYTSNVVLLSKLSLTYVYADIANKILTQTQVYSLLPDLSSLTAIIPSIEINKCVSVLKERLSFPQWLGKFSTTNKNKRLLKEISTNLCNKTSLYGYNLIIDGFLNILYQTTMKKLMMGSLEDCVEYMKRMGITKDMLVDNIASLRLKNEENLYAKVPTSIKTKLTKLFTTQMIKSSSSKRKIKLENSDVKTSVDDRSDDALSSPDLYLTKLKPTKKVKKTRNNVTYTPS
ncbi:Replication factor RFC1 C terminal domain protein [Theileria parva strain Muguga]|uniref:Replication factor RFC1 C terminal domain protein n=1 Tax=Theileria parva strain Muguga TaxID=333668 RepID=UPI001C61945A|nr:Replication factor RFC1 C terminal domain protein [Theileria parva strain Muguga]KAF5153159.1 Replication factor RFC1 C terminal domain protein [Theileria parva strain Muguga]